MRLKYQLKFLDYVLFTGMHQFFSVPVQVFYVVLSVLIPLTGSDVLRTRLLSSIVLYLVTWIAQQAFNVIYLAVGRYRALLTDHIVEVQDDGFYDETPYSRSTYLWAGIDRVVRRWGFIAVYIHSQGGFIIPNRAFDSADHRNRFFLSLKERLGSAK